MPTSATKKRLTLLAAFASLIVLVGWFALNSPPNPLRAPARQEWKDHAISLIQHRATDPAWIAAQTASLHALTTTRPYANWVGDELLLMKNGDWIICQNVCRKQAAHIEDLFIGLGSDGKWYYSTFHFCVNMNVLINETQPASLLQFADGYSLRPFDGHSNDCLQSTWNPGQPYGVDYYNPSTPNR